MILMICEQRRQIKQPLLHEPVQEELAASHRWNIPVANPATGTLSDCFKPDGAPCASLRPALLSMHACQFQRLSN